MAAQQLSDGSPEGCLLGRSDDKIGFYGTTAVAQPTAATALTAIPVSTTGGVFGFSSSAQMNAMKTAVNLLISNNALTGLDA